MPHLKAVSAYIRTLKEGRYWYASWHEDGTRVVRPTGVAWNPQAQGRRPGRGNRRRAQAARRARSGPQEAGSGPGADLRQVRRDVLRSGRRLHETAGGQGEAAQHAMGKRPTVDDRQARHSSVGRDAARFLQRCGGRDLARRFGAEQHDTPSLALWLSPRSPSGSSPGAHHRAESP